MNVGNKIKKISIINRKLNTDHLRIHISLEKYVKTFLKIYLEITF